MSNIVSSQDLVAAIERLGLLDAARVQEVRVMAARVADARELARELLHRDWLTAFQVNQLLTGKGESLRVGPYLLLVRLGQGGMGEVYKAKHQRLERIAALKLIHRSRVDSDDAVRRFQREMRMAAQLTHPNVVLAIDAEEIDGTCYLAMEFVDGTDLARIVKDRGPLTVAEACDAVRQAARGLHHAHERGLVHRDIKPSNLIRSARDGVVKVLDLGLARLQEASGLEEPARTLTQEGSVLGTPDYMAPEQIEESHEVDGRADIYSLGCSFYFLLTGRPPFPGGTARNKMARHLKEEPEPVERLRADVPASLAHLIRRMMAKAPEQRPSSPRDVELALTALLDGKDLSALPLSNLLAAPVPVSDTPFAEIGSSQLEERGSRSRNQRRHRLPLGRLAASFTGFLFFVAIAAGTWRWVRKPTTAVELPPSPTAPVRTISALDRLDPKQLAPEVRSLELPTEVVAILGHQRVQQFGDGLKIYDLAWSPSGARVATGDSRGSLQLWDAETGAVRSRVATKHSHLNCLRFSPDGTRIAAGTKSQVYFFEIVADGFRERGAFVHNHGETYSLDFSPRGEQLAVGAGVRRVFLLDSARWSLAKSHFDVSTVERIWHISHRHEETGFVVGGAAASDKGAAFALVVPKDDVWMEAASEIFPQSTPVVFCTSPRRQLLAVGINRGVAYIWDIAKSLPEKIDEVHLPTRATAIAFGNQSKLVAMGLSSGTVRILTIDRQRSTAEEGDVAVGASMISSLQFSPDDRTVAVSCEDGTLHFLDEVNGRWRERWPTRGHTTPIVSLAFSPDGDALVSVDEARTYRLWNLATDGEPAEGIFGSDFTNAVCALTFAQKGQSVLRGGASGLYQRDRVAGDSAGWRLITNSYADRGAFGELQGHPLYAGVAADGGVLVWDLAPGANLKPSSLRWRSPGSGPAVRALAFSPECKWLALGDEQGQLRCWRRAPRWSEPVTLTGHQAAVTALAFLGEPEVLASGCQDGSIRLRHCDRDAPFSPPALLPSHSHPVAAIATAPDQRTLATLSRDGELALWNVSDWKRRKTWRLPTACSALQFAPDSRHLAVGSVEGMIFLLRVSE